MKQEKINPSTATLIDSDFRAKPAEFEIVRLTKADGPLTKRISLNSDGSTKSDGSGCRMARGSAAQVRVNGIAELATLISELGSDQAIALGALRSDLPAEVGVVTKHKLHGQPGVIARTADSIQYRAGKPGFVLFDFDSKGIPPDVETRLRIAWAVLGCAVSGAAWLARRFLSSPKIHQRGPAANRHGRQAARI